MPKIKMYFVTGGEFELVVLSRTPRGARLRYAQATGLYLNHNWAVQEVKGVSRHGAAEGKPWWAVDFVKTGEEQELSPDEYRHKFGCLAQPE